MMTKNVGPQPAAMIHRSAVGCLVACDIPVSVMNSTRITSGKTCPRVGRLKSVAAPTARAPSPARSSTPDVVVLLLVPHCLNEKGRPSLAR